MSHHRSHRHRHEHEGEQGRMIRARTSLEIAEAASYLETLAQALRAGGITVRRGQELAALRVGERAELKLEAGEEGGESVLKLELRWETPQPEARLEITPGVESAGGGQSAQDGQDPQASQSGQGSPGRQGGRKSGEQASGSEGA